MFVCACMLQSIVRMSCAIFNPTSNLDKKANKGFGHSCNGTQTRALPAKNAPETITILTRLANKYPKNAFARMCAEYVRTH